MHYYFIFKFVQIRKKLLLLIKNHTLLLNYNARAKSCPCSRAVQTKRSLFIKPPSSQSCGNHQQHKCSSTHEGTDSQGHDNNLITILNVIAFIYILPLDYHSL